MFWKKLNNIEALINFSSNINAINLFFAKKLGLIITWKINIKSQKGNALLLYTYIIIMKFF